MLKHPHKKSADKIEKVKNDLRIYRLQLSNVKQSFKNIEMKMRYFKNFSCWINISKRVFQNNWNSPLSQTTLIKSLVRILPNSLGKLQIMWYIRYFQDACASLKVFKEFQISIGKTREKFSEIPLSPLYF